MSLYITRTRSGSTSGQKGLTNVAITRPQARCLSRLNEFAAENTPDTGSGLSQEANNANKLTPKREPVPDRHTTEIEALAWISPRKHHVPSQQGATTRVATYDLILSAVSSLLNPVYQTPL